MRRALGVVLAAALVAGVALFVQRPDPVDAQGGGTVEVAVTYNGAPVVEKLKINKDTRSEEHTSELQSRSDLVCRLLLEKKKKNKKRMKTNPTEIVAAVSTRLPASTAT